MLVNDGTATTAFEPVEGLVSPECRLEDNQSSVGEGRSAGDVLGLPLSSMKISATA